MKDKRMFSKEILESDAFMSLPSEAKVLYFYLCMNSDDDGFCNSPRKVMNMCNANDDAMSLLAAKRFVLIFKDDLQGTIAVIKHWRIHNYIRSDRYKETKYKELMQELFINPATQAYSLRVDHPEAQNVIPNGIPDGVPKLDKNKLDKVSLDKDSIEKGSAEGKAMTPEAEQTAGTDESFNHKYYREKISKCIGANDYEGAKKYQRMAAALGYEFDVP